MAINMLGCFVANKVICIVLYFTSVIFTRGEDMSEKENTFRVFISNCLTTETFYP